MTNKNIYKLEVDTGDYKSMAHQACALLRASIVVASRDTVDFDEAIGLEMTWADGKGKVFQVSMVEKEDA